MKISIFTFAMLVLFLNTAMAGNQCIQLFKDPEVILKDLEKTEPLSEAQRNTLNSIYKADENFYGFLDRLDIRKWVVQSLSRNLTESEKKIVLRNSFSNAFEWHKSKNKNKIGKFEVDAILKAETIRLSLVEIKEFSAKDINSQLRAVKRTIEPIFMDFEVHFALVQKLGEQVLQQSAIVDSIGERTEANAEVYDKNMKALKALKKRKARFDKRVGRNYHQYMAYKNMLEELRQSDSEATKSVVAELDSSLLKKVVSALSAEGFKYTQYTNENISDYVDTTGVASFARLLQDRNSELTLRFKLLAVNPTIVSLFRAGLLKVPEVKGLGNEDLKVKIQGFALGQRIVSASGFLRELISKALLTGYNLHLKSAYSESILEVISQRTESGMYDKLRTLNGKSENTDELLLIFARITEHDDYWEAIVEYAKNNIQGPQDQIFYDALMATQEKLKTLPSFSFYYSQSNGTAVSSIVGGVVAGYYAYHTAFAGFFGSLFSKLSGLK